ncbi:MAG: hypothetical protein ACR5LF_10140 [Symbiopectobacterium sp.]
MRRLLGLLLMTGATIVVVVSLIVSGLRLAMPQLDRFRLQIMALVTSTTGVSVDAQRLTGSWASFEPTLSIDGLTSESPAARWQFRDLTFHRIHLTLDATLTGQRADGSLIETDRLSTQFLQQFDHFDLRDSRLSFLTPSGDRAELAISPIDLVEPQQSTPC